MVWMIGICGHVSPLRGLYLVNKEVGPWYFDFDMLIELEVLK